jgi:flagellar basal-body rod protein FlgC
MLSALDVSTSALVAQRTRLNTISSNIANMSTLTNEKGEAEPYQERFAVFKSDPMNESGNLTGVQVDRVEIEQAEPLYRYEPEHPLAVKEGKWKGYVAYPNINMNQQFVDALEASRAYEANLGVMEVSKGLHRSTLSLLA